MAGWCSLFTKYLCLIVFQGCQFDLFRVSDWYSCFFLQLFVLCVITGAGGVAAAAYSLRTLLKNPDIQVNRFVSEPSRRMNYIDKQFKFRDNAFKNQSEKAPVVMTPEGDLIFR